ncbi:MAG: hypothetical protein AM1032_000339 [Mycoplasmataceae bacterium]|nr:MAG: hypothetical protein AM1032_000339 [Mycoplasmataceae bacterium]
MSKLKTQEWLSKFLEDSKEIKNNSSEDFKGSLVIESYMNLKKIKLIGPINKNGGKTREVEELTLKNLPLLIDCCIKNCKLKKIIIENCPNIRTLEFQDNFINNLEFVQGLNKLEYLNVNNNKEIHFDSGLKYLPSSLEDFSYEGTELEKILGEDWETSRDKSIEEINNNPYLFWDLTIKYKYLKIKLAQYSSNNNIQDSTNKIVSIFEFEFNAKESKIIELEENLKDLIELKKSKNQKIKEYVDKFGIEKELLSKLINDYLEYINIDKKESKSDDDFLKVRLLQEIYLKTMRELEDKLDNKHKSKLLRILEECKKNLIDKDSEIKEITDELILDIKEINDKVSNLLMIRNENSETTINYYISKTKEITNNYKEIIQSIVGVENTTLNDFAPMITDSYLNKLKELNNNQELIVESLNILEITN